MMETDLSQIRALKRILSLDGSSKYIIRLPDKSRIEAVYIPQQDGSVKVCISNQVGCVNKCSYCATGTQQFVRNMTTDEILGQIDCMLRKEISYGNIIPDAIGVLFMGMGEPFFNYENVISAIKGIDENKSRVPRVESVIVSTSGVVPGIMRFAKETTPARLAVSINAPNDSIRSSLMPINLVYPMKEVLSACSHYVSTTKKRIIIEYVLLADLNDSVSHAQEFADMVRYLTCEIHLIPFNAHKKVHYRSPSSSAVARFQSVLRSEGLMIALKPSYGTDILGGCGQLSRAGRCQISGS